MQLIIARLFVCICVYIDQQDAQEFLSELLDALHEDLNRYRKSTTPALTTSSPAAAVPTAAPQQESESQGHSDQPSLTKNGQQEMGLANGADGENKLQLAKPPVMINVEVS